MAKKSDRKDPSGLLVGAGVLLGLGFGFLFENIVPWLFIGLGAGLVAMFIAQVMRK